MNKPIDVVAEVQKGRSLNEVSVESGLSEDRILDLLRLSRQLEIIAVVAAVTFNKSWENHVR